MSNNPSATRQDPLTAFCFSLQIAAVGIQRGQAFFQSVSGLKSESEVIPHREGGLNGSTHQLIGPVKWPNLVLKRGFTGPPFQLIKWREALLDESGRAPGSGSPPENDMPMRVSGKIIQLGSDMKPICAWNFTRGWPCKWEGPDFDAGRNELAIETLEIAHEGLTFEPMNNR